jgi:pimeloyl-ACP methyl ester carboxylesterase
MHHEHILAGIHAVDLLNISARKQAETQLGAHIDSEGVKQFLLKNLYWKEKGTLAWRMNVNVLEREMETILSAMNEVVVTVPTLFIRGAMSNYILDDDIDDIDELFIDSEFVTIDNAGHWVHAEASHAFLESLLSFCLR